MVGDRERASGSGKSLIESMLEEGLSLFGHNETEQAVAIWRRVLELSPQHPRALDYLESAGAPLEAPIVRLVPLSSASFPPVEVTADEREAAEARSAASAPISAESSPPQGSRLAKWFLAILALALAAATVGAIVAWLGLRDSRGGPEAQPATEATVPVQAIQPVERGEAPVATGATPGVAKPQVVDEFFNVVLEVEPDTATIEIDGVEVARGSFVGRFPRTGESHVVKVSASGYQDREITFVDAEPPDRIQLESLSDRRADRSTAADRERRRAARRRRRAAERAIAQPAATPPKAEPTTPATPAAKPAAKPASQTPKTDNIDPWSSK